MNKQTKQAAASLDELLREVAEKNAPDLPKAGGECDTNRGWARRLGISEVKARQVIDMMTKDGRADRVRGITYRGPHPYSMMLIRSPTLAAAATS